MTIPPPHDLLLFAGAAAMLVAVPGPNHLYVASRAVSAGRSAGLAASVGIEAGTAVHVALAAAGLTRVVASSPEAVRGLTLADAGYLTYIAFRARQGAAVHRESGPSPARRDWARELGDAAAVNLLNPKVILFFVAFLPPFIDPHAGDVPGQVVSYGIVLVALGALSNTGYALAASTMSARSAGNAHRAAWTGRLQAAVYLVLAAAAVATSSPDAPRATRVHPAGGGGPAHPTLPTLTTLRTGTAARTRNGPHQPGNRAAGSSSRPACPAA